MSIFDMYYTKIIKSHLKVQLSDGLITVRPARTCSNGCKSLTALIVGMLQPEERVSSTRRNLKKVPEEIWSDGRKSDMRPMSEDKIAPEIEV